jgi:hypothetical protein
MRKPNGGGVTANRKRLTDLEIRQKIVYHEAKARELDLMKKPAEAASHKIRAFALRETIGLPPSGDV